MSDSKIGFVIAVPKVNPLKPQTYVGNPRDGGWRTWNLFEVKVWKTYVGALKWIAQRPGTGNGAKILKAKLDAKGKLVEVLG